MREETEAIREHYNADPQKEWNRLKKFHPYEKYITIILELRKKYVPSGISINEIAGKTQSLMCNRNRNGLVNVETPNKKTKEYYKMISIDIPSNVKIETFKHKVLCITGM